MDESIAIPRLCSHDWDRAVVHALHDGDWVERGTVMSIEGDYRVRAPRDRDARHARASDAHRDNTARVVEAANGKPIIFMPARHDHHRVQTGDGYAAFVARACSEPRSA